MYEYEVNVILEPHLNECVGRRYLTMNIHADDTKQALEFGRQMLNPLLKDSVELILEITL